MRESWRSFSRSYGGHERCEHERSRAPPNCLSSLVWDRAVPLAVPFVLVEMDAVDPAVGDLNDSRVDTFVELGSYVETVLGRCRFDELDHCPATDERPSATITATFLPGATYLFTGEPNPHATPYLPRPGRHHRRGGRRRRPHQQAPCPSTTGNLRPAAAPRSQHRSLRGRELLPIRRLPVLWRVASNQWIASGIHARTSSSR